MSNPTGLWFRFHVNAHEHPKVIRLRSLAGNRADAACWGWFAHVLAGAKRYGAWTFADESHLRHVAGKYATFLDLYREVGLLDDLTIHGGEEYNAPKDVTAAERMRRHRSSRDDGYERNERNAVTPRAEQSRTEQSTVTREGWPNLDGPAIAALEARTGTPWSLAGDKQLGEYDRLIGAHGLTAVCGAMDAVSNGKRLTGRQLIWPAMKLLEPLPDTRALAAAEREAERDEQSKRGVEATLRRIHGYGAHEAERHPACPSCLGVAS